MTLIRALQAAAAALLMTTVGLAGAAGAAKPVAASTADDYVALGDSYSAGNGAFSTNLNVGCGRNTYAYGPLVAKNRPNTALTFVACQGAVTSDVTASQVGALSAGTEYVTITVGGNDVGFANLIFNCIGWSDAQCKSAVDTTNDKIANELPAKLDATYAAIKSRATAAKAVVVLGYPRMFGSSFSCAAAGGVSATKVGWLNGVADNLDAVISDRARAAGFSYRSAIAAFAGHDVCASDPWVNGSTWSMADSWHPTRSGYANGYQPLVRAIIG